MDDQEKLHPGHHSIRLPGRDYSAPGLYFVTICTHEKVCILGNRNGEHLESSRLGQIVHETWIAIPNHFPQVNLHDFVIMPNHLHGLIQIARQVGAQHAAPLQPTNTTNQPHPAVRPGSLGAIVRSFKAAATLRARRELAWKNELWQRNYFERVLRDGQEFSDATRYIRENPLKWALDSENPKATRDGKPSLVGAQHAAPLPPRR